MTNFEIGKKYRIANTDWQREGNIIEIIGKTISGYRYKTISGIDYMTSFSTGSIFSAFLVPHCDRHELHVTSDGVTTNAVYKLNGKVKKQAKAVCCPSDTFNFNTGAELAINRVLYGTDYNPKDVAIAKLICVESAPKQDEPKEAVTLYCVKDYTSYLGSHWLTKGKTYEFNGYGVTFNDGFCGSGKRTFDEWSKRNPNISACLIRAEKRPAKVGEWVVALHEADNVPKGSVKEVLSVNWCGSKNIRAMPDGEGGILSPSEYLVLPDYVPEKVEPEYYNGKVVCVDNGGAQYFEVGKVYQFLGGRIFGAHGFYSSQYETLEKANSRNGVGAKFIEYRGEQL